MAEMKESSVLFSLKQLMDLEQDRMREEEEAARRRMQAEMAARMELEQRTREAELARIRAEDERRRLDETRRREEEARLEALRQAEVAKARVEAEQRARLEAMTKQQEHERALAVISQDAQKKKLKRIVTICSIGGLVALGATLGTYFGKIKPEAEAREAQQAAILAEQEEQRRKLESELAEQRSRLATLEQERNQAKSAAERLEIERKIEELKSTKPQLGGRPAATTKPEQPKVVCNEGDPLCNDLR